MHLTRLLRSLVFFKMCRNLDYWLHIAYILSLCNTLGNSCPYHKTSKNLEQESNIADRKSSMGSVMGMDTLLQPLAGCIINLDLFRKVEIPALSIPVIIGHMKPLKTTRETSPYGMDISKQILVPVGDDYNLCDTISCYPAYLYGESYTKKENGRRQCLMRNAFVWMSSARPWKCEVQVSLYFPVAFKLDEYNEYPRMYRWWHTLALVPQVFVLLDKIDTTVASGYTELCQFVAFNHYSVTSVQNIFILGSIQWKDSVNFGVTNIRLMYRCKSPKLITDLSDLNSPQPHLFKKPWDELSENEQTWSVSQNLLMWYRTKTDIPSSMIQCNNKFDSQSASIANTIATIKGHENKVLAAQSYILLTLMGNYSYGVGLEIVCKSGQKKTARAPTYSMDWPRLIFVQYLSQELPFNSLIVFNDTTKILRFVSCGTRGSSKLAFYQLVSVFDKYTWLFLTIFAMLVSIFKNATISGGMDDELFSVMKCFLEQGNPFLLSSSSDRSYHWTVSAVLLVGIVMSNAYKNDNVYKMIVPRQRLGYEHLWQLEHDNFTLYSRITELVYVMPTSLPSIYWFRPDDVKESINTMNRSTTTGSFYGVLGVIAITATPEVTQLERQSRRENYKDSKLEKAHGMFSVPKLALDAIFYSLKDLLMQKTIINDSTSWELAQELKTKYESDESSIFSEALLRCNKTAILVPSVEAFSYWRELSASGQDGDIGVDTIGGGLIGINIVGSVNNGFIRRLWGMQQSGIIKWWHMIVAPGQKVDTTRPNDNGSGAKLTGNITILFFVLIFGAMLSCLVFLLEAGKRILNICLTNLKKTTKTLSIPFQSTRDVKVIPIFSRSKKSLPTHCSDGVVRWPCVIVTATLGNFTEIPII